MKFPTKAGGGLSSLQRNTWIMAGMWTLITAASLVWNILQSKHHALQEVRSQARAIYEKDVFYRYWNAGHGGVYVPVTEEMQPNPYLRHVPDRDIITTSGKLLTLVNPAYMTRQVHELMEDRDGEMRGHITSLNPLRPENKPDAWEAEALAAFEEGAVEVSSLEEMDDGRIYLRLMRPMITEEMCLKCHAAQGYQVGDMRGGISVSLSAATRLTDNLRVEIAALSLTHSLLWFLGLGLIILGNRKQGKVEEAMRAIELSLSEAQRIAHIGNWELDLMRNELRWSDEVYRIFGIEPQDFKLTYEGFLDLVHPKDRNYVHESYSNSVGRDTRYDIAHRLVRPDGEVRYVQEIVEDIQDEAGNKIRSVGTVQDVTESKQAEEELEEHREHLENLVEERTKELRTTVNSMAGREVRMAELKGVIKQLREQLAVAGMTPVTDDPLKINPDGKS